MSDRELNPRQERFIEFFVATGNATQSAIKAGYSEKAAHARGHELKNRYQAEIEKKTRAAIRSSFRSVFPQQLVLRAVHCNFCKLINLLVVIYKTLIL